MLKGIAASSGIAICKALVINETDYTIERRSIVDIEAELKSLHATLLASKEEIKKLKEITLNKLGPSKAEIFEAHLMMLEDPELIGSIEGKIKDEGINAEYAVKITVDMFVAIFEGMVNDYMRERAADIKDIGKRLIFNLLGIKHRTLSILDEEFIVVAKDLTPSETVQMDHDKVLGFVTDIGGKTSHSAIMARSLDIPAVVGLGNITTLVKDGDALIIDGDKGTVYINPEEAIIEEYKKKQEKARQEKQELQALLKSESVTLDGRRVELAGNIGTPENVSGVLKNGGEGVGLFRTEFLYMDKEQMPSEEEQFQAYKRVLEEMQNKPLVIRTLDIGGDKKLPYLPIKEELNPFLGYRAIRICLKQRDIFRAQIRALLRASIYGNLKIMFPMIATLEELREAKAFVEEMKQELSLEKVAYSNDVEIGIMIEIPSAAIISDVLAREADFFSIGTNDLIQYTVAVDRMNENVSYLYSSYNPAVLRLIKTVIDNAHKEGKWVGMCGEMAGDVKLVPVLLGFGLDEFSMSASSILKVRSVIRSIEYRRAKAIAEDVLKLGTVSEVEDFLNRP